MITDKETIIVFMKLFYYMIAALQWFIEPNAYRFDIQNHNGYTFMMISLCLFELFLVSSVQAVFMYYTRFTNMYRKIVRFM